MKTLIVNIAIATCAATAALTAAPEARAASDFLLELEGIKGESRASAPLNDFRWSMVMASGAFNPFTPTFAGGVSVAVGDIAGDGRWDSLTLGAREAGGAGQTFFQYIMPLALATPAPAAGGDHREWILIESMTAPVMRYRPLLPGGLRGDPLTGTWDSAGRFVGDPGVFAAFDELGAVRWPDGSLAISTPVPEPATWALGLLGAGLLARRLRREQAAA